MIHFRRKKKRLSKYELLPCPFCGREAELVSCKTDSYYVFCTNRRCGVGQHYGFTTEKKAIKAWNRRRK